MLKLKKFVVDNFNEKRDDVTILIFFFLDPRQAARKHPFVEPGAEVAVAFR